MPTAQLKAMAKEAGVTMKEAEKCWDDARALADKVYKDKEKNGEYWGYVTIRTKMCLGIEHKPKGKKK